MLTIIITTCTIININCIRDCIITIIVIGCVVFDFIVKGFVIIK